MPIGVSQFENYNFTFMPNTENNSSIQPSSISTTIAPWLSVRNSQKAVEFYKSAFGAFETYRLDADDGGVVARLSIEGAEFWLSDESPNSLSPESLGGGSVRMILTVADPDALFSQALKAGASEIFPVSEAHGWRLGRLVDPYGHHWEIGRPTTT
jgi:PhnB protein